MKNPTVGCFLLLFDTCVLSGQDFYYAHYKVEDGLSHDTIMSSLQVEKVFLWFGTKNGLNRFEGHKFRLFRNNPENTEYWYKMDEAYTYWVSGNTIGASR